MPYPATDGESIVIMNDVDVLRKLGHSVSIFALNTSKHKVDTKDYANFNFWDGFDTFDYNPNTISHLVQALYSKFPFQIARFFTRSIQVRLSQFLLDKKFDIVIYQGLAMTQYQSLFDIPQLYRVHNLEYNIWKMLSENTSSIFKRFYFKLIAQSLEKYEKKFATSIDQLITLSADEESILTRYYPNKVTTIPISITTPFFTNYRPEAKGILFVGSLDWLPNRQGLDWFISEVYPSISDIPMTIAGRGNYISHHKNITIVSNFKSIEELFQSHRLMIVPILSGAGIRIKILEAMKYGIPIIATPVGAEGIKHTNNCISILPPSSDWITEIQKIYFDETYLSTRSEELKQSFNAYYSEESIIQHWANCIKKAL